ncbi:MAG TPA: radical SAM protein, partial [Candidatus Limnocylindria bacterium]|nr:radical SAM protein [Candidatus Limnocylindria bacterium]
RLDPRVCAERGAAADTVELELPHRLMVAARITDATPWVLTARGAQSFLEGPESAAPGVPVVCGRPPRFYDRTTSHGTPMHEVATVRGRHLVIAPGGACGFATRGTPCPFCLEGARSTGGRAGHLDVLDVVEVVHAALAERRVDAVYFNSCAFDAEDGGISFVAPYVEAVRRHVDTLIAVQVHPPATADWVDRTYALGVDAVSYNLELFDPDVLMRQCVGRARYIGRERYLEVLARAAQVFPNGAVWCELVCGIEPPDATRAGIEALAAMGVVPVLVVPAVAAANGRLLDDMDALLAHLVATVTARGLNTGWVHGLPSAISPAEAGARASWTTTIQFLQRRRLGAFVLRNLARTRRRLRVRPTEPADAH